MKRRGLGRGLDSLIPETPSAEGDRVAMLAVGDIDPNPSQPRRRFDKQALSELADSMRQVGVLQPILVCEAEGRYRIIAGERRWRAARLAELPEIPAIIREMGEVERLEAALVENVQREDLNPVEEAAALRALMDECGLTQEAVSLRLGKSRPAVANLLRLLTLPEAVLTMLREGALSAGHARALVGMADAARCVELAKRAASEGWSVRETEREAARAQDAKKPAPKRRALPELTELEDRLRGAFGMRVKVSGTLEKGRITLQYASREALERLYEALGEDWARP